MINDEFLASGLHIPFDSSTDGEELTFGLDIFPNSPSDIEVLTIHRDAPLSGASSCDNNVFGIYPEVTSDRSTDNDDYGGLSDFANLTTSWKQEAPPSHTTRQASGRVG